MANKVYFEYLIDKTGQPVYVRDVDAAAEIASIKERISHSTQIIGFTSTALQDGDTVSTLQPVFTGSLLKTTGFETGDLVYYRPAAVNSVAQATREFICLNVKTSESAEASLIWCEYGSTGSLGSLAFKDNVGFEYTPKGSVAVSLGVTNDEVVGEYTQGKVDPGTNPSIQDGFLNQGKPTEVTPGDLPSFAVEYDATNRCISFAWNPGTKTTVVAGTKPSIDTTKFNPGTPTKVTLPSVTKKQVVIGVGVSNAVFTGTKESIIGS